MQLDKFTLKSQEAIQAAQQLAQNNGNQELQPEHLLKAILEQPEGVVVPVLQKMGITPSVVLAETNQLINHLPKVTGSGASQTYASQHFRNLLDQAFNTFS
jgi:ATP-dependent Clp protease ATP-binding subunit ClpB